MLRIGVCQSPDVPKKSVEIPNGAHSNIAGDVVGEERHDLDVAFGVCELSVSIVIGTRYRGIAEQVLDERVRDVATQMIGAHDVWHEESRRELQNFQCHLCVLLRFSRQLTRVVDHLLA